MADDRPDYLSHSRSDSGRMSPLREHLADVAARAEEYASIFGAGACCSIAKYLGYMKLRYERRTHS